MYKSLVDMDVHEFKKRAKVKGLKNLIVLKFDNENSIVNWVIYNEVVSFEDDTKKSLEKICKEIGL